ncbi:MAG: helix-turn-helix domain-containing protein [Candidatus Marinimicrobia bacterium]|nr:helix-turn-helix domain-containing protein [Candidatus Neomarinimicrobiota bacterium]
MSSIAERLREFRAAVGLTQREVASMCGLGKRTIIYWEMGDREIKCSKLVPLVHEYDLDFNWLILGNGSMFIDTTVLEEVAPDELNKEEVVDSPEPESGSSWEAEPKIFKKEQEDVLPLIQRLRRK